jgi:hypothetical protein
MHSTTIKNTKFPICCIKSRATIPTAAMNVPNIIYGILLPICVSVLSESQPNKGSINRARMLSIPIIAPVTVELKPKSFSRMSGMMLS